MPKITIDNETFDLPQKKENVLDNIPNSEYGQALEMVRGYMKSINHNPGESIEDVFDILIEQEHEGNIRELIEKGDKLIEEEYAEAIKNIETQIMEETVKYYEEKAKERQARNLKLLKDGFKNNWKKSAEEVRNATLEELFGKDRLKATNKDEQEAFLTKVAKGDKNFDENEINGDSEFLEKAGKLKKEAKAVLDYYSTKDELLSNKMIDHYVEHNVKTDPDNYYKNHLENSYEYTKYLDEIKTAKEDLRSDVKERGDEFIDEDTPLTNAKKVYLQQKQEKRQQFKDVIAKREELVSNYKSTNIFSRIARWVLPNSWSTAGKIQNEIDKLDKAVKDAGYEKEDVATVQKELREESLYLSSDAIDTTLQNVVVEDTIDLQNNLGKDSGSKNFVNSEKVTQNEKIEERELK